MIQPFVDHFMASKEKIITGLKETRPQDYKNLVERLVSLLGEVDDYDGPDLERIVVIDHGDYQGTLLFIIGAKGYQPSNYWCIPVGYGSCSGCDTLEAIGGYSDDPVTDEQANEYWTLMLHMVQKMKAIGGYEESV